MHQRRVRRWAGLGVSAMVLAAVPLSGFNLLGVASADDGAPATEAPAAGTTKSLVINGKALTSDQIQCLTDHGFAPPEPPAPVAGESGPHVETHQAEAGDTDKFAALKDAAAACGLPVPDGASAGPGVAFGEVNGTPLTDEQMQCLTDHGAPPPSLKEGDAPAPGPVSKEAEPKEADAFRTAAEACGLPAPPAGAVGGPGMSAGFSTSKQG